MRVKDSSSGADQAHVADQMASFAMRRSEEIVVHGEAIAVLRSLLPKEQDERSLQFFLATELVSKFAQLGARAERTLTRNQVLQCDEQTDVVAFSIADSCLLALLPTVVASSGPQAFRGTLNIGFRLMSPASLAAPTFEFGRDTVLHLHELLPNKFNGYGRFDGPDEFCLNVVAWTTALRIVLPDVLQTLGGVNALTATGHIH